MPYRSSLRRFGKNLVVPSADSGSSRPKSVFLTTAQPDPAGLAESFVARTLKGTWLLVVVGALLVLVGALLLPDVARAAVPAGVTKGLDYLHAHQRGDGGFSRGGSHSSASLTPWVTLAIAAGANHPALWRVEGHSPVTFLQATDLTSAAAASGNAPEYYALCILPTGPPTAPIFSRARAPRNWTSSPSLSPTNHPRATTHQRFRPPPLRAPKIHGVGDTGPRRRSADWSTKEQRGDLASDGGKQRWRKSQCRWRVWPAIGIAVEHDGHLAGRAGAGCRRRPSEQSRGARRRRLH